MLSNLEPMYTELLCLACGGAPLGVYQLYLRARLRRAPDYSIQSVNDRAREAWVEEVMRGPAHKTLAVQTLRNSTMAAVFLASTAILLTIGLLTLEPDDFRSLQGGGELSAPVWAMRLLPLLIDLFSAFFLFSLALRMYNHVGYLIGAGDERAGPSPRYVARLLNRGSRYHALGTRAYYLSVPMFFGLFNPYYLVVSAAILTAVFYHIDRAPTHGATGPTSLASTAQEGASSARLRVISSGFGYTDKGN